MMKLLLIVFLFCITLSAKDSKIKYFDVAEGYKLSEVVNLINLVSDVNIMAGEDAGKAVLPELTLKNRSPRQILEALCVTANVAYSYSHRLDQYNVMSLEKYAETLSYALKEQIRTFKVDPLNLVILAESLEALYGERLFLSLGEEVEQESLESGSSSSSSSNNSSGNSSSSNNSSDSSSSSTERKEFKKISSLKVSVDMVLDLEDKKRAMSSAQATDFIEKYVVSMRREELAVSLSVNHEHSLLVIRTADIEVFKEIEDFLKENDVQVPQVLLEMKILELTVGDDFKSIFGVAVVDPTGSNEPDKVNDLLQFIPNGRDASLGDATLAYRFLDDRIDARIELLKSDNLVETLATPILIAANNRESEIKLVNNEVFIDGFEYVKAILDSDDKVIEPATLITEFTKEDVGLTLRIKPQIHDDGTVTLLIYQESSTKIKNGASVPVAVDGKLQDRLIDIKSEKTISSTVMARDKMTVAIGGQIRSENSTEIRKVPILGDIPLLGYFFRKEVTVNVKKELILLITPHVMRNGKDGERRTQKVMKRLSDHKFNEKGEAAIDDKNGNLQQYRSGDKFPIRDFVKEADQSFK